VGKFEWIIAVNLIIITILLSGIISLYLGIHTFLNIYVKSIGKKQQIGLISEIEVSGINHLLKLWIRAIILGFFISNLAFSIASNQSFVFAMVTPDQYKLLLDQNGFIPIPDPTLMLMIIWIIAILCTFIVVPIWFMIDAGLAASKRAKGFEFSSVNLATSRLYKIIKGYAVSDSFITWL